MNLKEYLTEGLNKCNIQITNEQTEKLLLFMDIVLRENKKFNLTAITDEKEFIEKHIIDSALSIKYIKNNGKLIDIGSGAGMPGIIIKILREDLDILLLDSLNKRVNYLNNTIKELNLNNIEAIHQRAEELSHDEEYREQFDYVTARAVASLNVLLEYTIPFIKKEGSFIALKGSKGEEEIEQSKNDIIAMGKSRNDIEFVIDYLTLRKEKYQVISKLAMTQSVFMLEGWIPEKRLGKLINELNKYDVYVEVSNPKENEQAPVAFQNGSFVNPVENLTESYSMPGPEDIDPNPFMAFFYYLLFGLMLSDAGYGILMALASGYFSFIAKVEQKTKRLMRMFFFCSLSTIFWGAIFGSWFGDLFTRISTNFFNPPSDATIAIWMDPLKDPMTLIIFSLVVGVIHIIVGLIAKFYGLCKHGKIIDALCDSGLHIIMLLGLLTMAGGIALMPETKLGIIGGYTAAGAFILAVLTSARSAKGIGKLTSIFSSIYNILTGYLSDILSYSRLMALCLTTGAIGMVVNQLGTMMGNNIFGYIFFAVIFVFGHAINLGINALGTYVHCNRLQYVEFFKQFYEGGGKAFKPFAVNTKYVKFREEN